MKIAKIKKIIGGKSIRLKDSTLTLGRNCLLFIIPPLKLHTHEFQYGSIDLLSIIKLDNPTLVTIADLIQENPIGGVIKFDNYLFKVDSVLELIHIIMITSPNKVFYFPENTYGVFQWNFEYSKIIILINNLKK